MSFGILAPVFPTQIVDLSDVTDLAANATILPAMPDSSSEYRAQRPAWNGQAVFIQCIAGGAKWRCGGTEPTDDADGHILAEGDGLIVALTIGESWWVWPSESGTKLAVSPADSVPTRAPLTRLSDA